MTVKAISTQQGNIPDHIKCNLYVAIFIIFHMIIWTLAPTFFRPSITHDTWEGIAWGMQWQWGYNKHPFLAAWLSAGVTDLFGKVGWPVYALAQAAVAVTFFSVWRLATEFFSPKVALIAALSLEGVLFYTVNSINFTPDTLQSALWASLALCLYRALTTRKLRYWAAVGIWAGLSVITKYQAVLFFLPIFFFLLMSKEARQKVTWLGIGLASGLAILIVSPHLIWLYQHDFISVKYALHAPLSYSEDMPLEHFSYPMIFIFSNIAYISGVFVLFWPFYRSPKSADALTPFQWEFILYLGLGPFCLSFFLCALTGDFFPARWSTPYFFLIGMLMVATLKPDVNSRNYGQFGMTLVFVSIVLCGVRFLNVNFRHPQDAFLPNQVIAKELSQWWRTRYHSPLSYVAGSHYLTAALATYSKDKPIPYLGFERLESPWIDEAEVKKKGALVVWDAGYNYVWDESSANQTALLPPQVLKRFPTLQWIQTVVFYRLDKERHPVLIKVGVIPPNEQF